MISSIYDFVSLILSALGLDSLLSTAFGSSLLADVSASSFLFLVACLLIVGYFLSFVFRLVYSLILNIVEVLSYD